jgi:hypothetical protein
MANPDSNELILVNLCFSPKSGTTLSEKLADCYRQFSESNPDIAFSKNLIVKQTLFISAKNKSEYYQSKQKLLAFGTYYLGMLPPTSVLAQSPDNESIVLEIVCLQGAKPNELTRKRNEVASWCLFQRRGLKLVFAAGLCLDEESDDVLNYSLDSFTKVQNILAEEGMNFSDIIRQWNYIEQITETVGLNGKKSQHYQIFNDVRSKYYRLADFINGYPAATGIGMDFGGISIDFIAAKSENQSSVIGIKSPVQVDAYHYTEAVLRENCAMTEFCRTTPKFERAKLFLTPENKWIFISGTAAILGQDSADKDSVEYQTEMTIQNIQQLISVKNLHRHGINTTDEPKISYLRVYVKLKKDMLVVKQICDKYFANIPIAYIIADICRPELLVEIEGQAILN